jgi:hypothetical protein
MTDKNRKEYYKKWKNENREAYNEYYKEYRKKHKKKISKQAKNRRLKNADKNSEWNKEYRASSPRTWLSKRLSNAKITRTRYGKTTTREKNIDIDFLVELWKKQNGLCSITKYPMIHGPNSLFSASIDRINSDKGYTKDNVQLVCQAINFAKNKFSNEDMIEFWNFKHTLSVDKT